MTPSLKLLLESKWCKSDHKPGRRVRRGRSVRAVCVELQLPDAHDLAFELVSLGHRHVVSIFTLVPDEGFSNIYKESWRGKSQ